MGRLKKRTGQMEWMLTPNRNSTITIPKTPTKKGKSALRQSMKDRQAKVAQILASKSSSKTKSKTKVRVKNEAVNGNQAVVCTHVNIGHSTKKDKQKWRKIATNGATVRDTYQGTFFLMSKSTDGSNQIIKDVGAILNGAGYANIVNKAFDVNAVWQSLRPGLTTASSEALSRIAYIKTELEWTNMQKTITFIDVYYLMAKRDNELTTYDSPRACWVTGVDTTDGLNTNSISFPNSGPTESKFFRENWKVLHHASICQNPGEVRKMTYYDHVEKSFNYAKTLGRTSIRGLTRFIMIVGRGPCIDNANIQYTDPTVFSLAPVKIVGRFSTSYSLTTSIRPSKMVGQNSSGLTSTIPANMYTLKDDDGEVVNVVTGNIG